MSQWVILWCEEDTSYSLVRDCELICDLEHLRVGDVVTFYYERKEYQGVVRELAGDDDYDRLVQRLTELNASNKAKESSFHVELPRKSAKKFMDSLTNSKSAKTSKNSASRSKRNKSERSGSSKRSKPNEPLVPGKSVTPLAKLLAADVYSDGDSDDGSNRSRSPPSSPKPEDISEDVMRNKLEVKRVSQSKNYTQDIAVLKNLRTKQCDSQSSGKTRAIEQGPHSTTSSRSINNNLSDKEEANDTDVSEGFPGNDIDSMDLDSDGDFQANPRNSSRSSHGQKSDITSEGAGREKGSIFRFGSPLSAQGEKDRDRANKSDCDLPANSGNSSQSCRGHQSNVTNQDSKSGEGSMNSLLSPTTPGANDKGDGLMQQLNKSSQRDHSNEHLTHRRVSLFGKSGIKSPTPFGSDDIGQDQRTDNHRVGDLSESDNDGLIESTPKKPAKKKSKPSRPPMTFPGKMLKQQDDDPDVVALKSADGKNVIYIASSDLKAARAAGNAKLFVRSLLEGVFTEEALYQCTLVGGEYRAGGKGNITRKPQLDQVAINVILDLAMGRQKSKDWRPVHDREKLKSTMRQKLVDLRPKLKRIFEEVEETQ